LRRVSELWIEDMFTFKFESSLNYRKAVEERKLVDFSATKERFSREKEILEEIQKEQNKMKEQFKKMQDFTFNSSDVSLHLSYIKLFKEKEMLQQEIIKKVSLEVEISRKELLEAVKERKIMDNLKERHLKEFNETIAVYERKIADETAVLSFLRNR
jgi:flagellar protein FliJ